MIKFSARIKPHTKPNQAILEIQPWEIEKLRHIDTNKLYVVDIKEFKSKRSLEQNGLMWGLIDKVNKTINGFRATKQSELEIYCQLIEMAQIKRELVATIPEAKPTLESTFRVVREVGKLKTDKGQELTKFLLYKGTSQFNTEEMSRFIDALLDYAIESGVDVREYDN